MIVVVVVQVYEGGNGWINGWMNGFPCMIWTNVFERKRDIPEGAKGRWKYKL